MEPSEKAEDAETLRKTAALAEWIRKTDRSPQVVETIRKARRALPGDPMFGDPLSTAGPGGARAVARVADRVLEERQAASRELGLGALQVWQAIAERVGKQPKSLREVTLVFTDLVGFSSWALNAGDDATLLLLRAVSRAIEPPMVDHSGHVVKRMGDGLMAVFPNAEQAVKAVISAKAALRKVDIDGFRPHMRVGIHTGSPHQIGSDWLGIDVNVAARLMENAGRGNIMISDRTLEKLDTDLLENLGLEARSVRRGVFSTRLDGVPEDIKLFRLKKTSDGYQC
ncbi:MAG: adenylate/guanylate cyclase domain-containing protein [Mycobacteriaceae bacterium]